jgi:hypothetical protein
MSTERKVRDALIVATGDYSDPKLRRLRGPAADAERLAAVLGSPDVGGFQVEVALNAEERELRRRLARFFSNRSPNDLLFLHLSCHGVKDAHGDLYLAAADTEVDLMSATGVPAAWLNEQLSRSRSRRTVVLLDCCFSGSFPFGARARVGGEVSMPDQFEGHGRGLAVITASSAMEYAYEGDTLSGEGQPSFFTEAVVEALESGKADRDQDHLISIQELYEYVYDCVKEKTPSQTPNIKSELQGPLYIARSSYEAPVVPVELDGHLLTLTDNPLAGARLGAVQELAALRKSRNRGLALSARAKLEEMVDDDSGRVSRAARTALAEGEAAAPATPVEPPAAPPPREPASAPQAKPPTQAPEPAPPPKPSRPHSAEAPPRPVRGAPRDRRRPPSLRRHARRWAIGLAALVVLAVAAGVIALSGGGDPDAQLAKGPQRDAPDDSVKDLAAIPIENPIDSAKELKQHVPPSIRGSCFRTDDTTATNTADIALLCNSGSVQLAYAAFSTSQALNKRYKEEVLHSGERRSSCANVPRGSSAWYEGVWRYSGDGAAAGRLTCHFVDSTGWIEATQARLGIYFDAVDDRKMESLYRVWRSALPQS